MRDAGFHWETKKLLMECGTLTGKVHLDCGAARVTEGPGKVKEMQGVVRPQAGKGGVEGGYLGKLRVLIPDSWIAQDSKNTSQHLLQTKLCQVIYKLSLVLKNTLQSRHGLPLLRDEEIEAQEGYVTCPRRHVSMGCYLNSNSDVIL